MAWTELLFPHEYETSEIMTQFHADFVALVHGDTGAPRLKTAAFDSGVFTTPKIGAAVVTEEKAAVPVKFPSGTRAIFGQAAAPTGWTQITEQNDKLLRIVSGAGGGTGGQWGGGITGSGGGHTHTLTSYASHKHVKGASGGNLSFPGAGPQSTADGSHTHTPSTASDHTHISLNDAWRPAYFDVIVCSKN